VSAPGYTVPPYVFEQRGTYDAPFEYTVPSSLEVRPDTATATFDGTGAAGPFLACLTFYSPEGSRLCRMFNPTPVAKGDVAEVTFIPPFGSAATGSATPGTAAQYEVLTATPIALTAGNVGIPSWSHSAGSNLVDLSTPTAPVPKVAGIFVAEFYASISTPPAAPGFLAELLLGQATVQAGLVATWAGAGGSACVNSVTAADHFAVTDTFECIIFNYNSAASETFTNLHLYIVQVA
jgi:hypothetical protein